MDARTPHPTYFISVCGKNVEELIQVLAYEGQPPFTWVTYCCPVVPGSKCFHCRDLVHLKALAPIHPLSSCLTCPALCSHTSANKLDFCSCLETLNWWLYNLLYGLLRNSLLDPSHLSPSPLFGISCELDIHSGVLALTLCPHCLYHLDLTPSTLNTEWDKLGSINDISMIRCHVMGQARHKLLLLP